MREWVVGGRRGERLLAAVVAALTAVVFLPSVQNGFVNWDDDVYLTANSHVRELGWDLLTWSFGAFHAASYLPLTWLSHAANVAIWGLDPRGHHLTSVLLHAMNAALVVLLVSALLDAGARRDAEAAGAPMPLRSRRVAAAVTGVLFALHPLRVESVAWASELKDVLCAAWTLIALLAYAAYATAPRDARGSAARRGFYVAALASFVVALLFKSMAVSLPAILLVLDWYPFRRLRSHRDLPALLVEKVPFLAIAAADAVAAFLAADTAGALSTLDSVPLGDRLLVAVHAVVGYLSRTAWPAGLGAFYAYPRNPAVLSLAFGVPIVLVVAGTAAALRAARTQRVWLAAWICFVVTLGPVLGLVQNGMQFMGDRFSYLASVAPLLLVGVGAARALDRLRERAPGAATPVAAAAALVVAVPLVWATVVQIRTWESSYTLWNSAISRGLESATAFDKRGQALEQMGRVDEALTDYDRAVALAPADHFARADRGVALYRRGQLDRALADLDLAVAADPTRAPALRNRGLLHLQMRNARAASADLQRACALEDAFACQMARVVTP